MTSIVKLHNQTNNNTQKNNATFKLNRKFEFGYRLLDFQLVDIYFDVDGMVGYVNMSTRTYSKLRTVKF